MTKTKRETRTRIVYTVLLYPPVGVPRVIPLTLYPTFEPLCAWFETPDKAQAALNKFLKENPEYKNWKDGSLHPKAK